MMMHERNPGRKRKVHVLEREMQLSTVNSSQLLQ